MFKSILYLLLIFTVFEVNADASKQYIWSDTIDSVFKTVEYNIGDSSVTWSRKDAASKDWYYKFQSISDNLVQVINTTTANNNTYVYEYTPSSRIKYYGAYKSPVYTSGQFITDNPSYSASSDSTVQIITLQSIWIIIGILLAFLFAMVFKL